MHPNIELEALKSKAVPRAGGGVYRGFDQLVWRYFDTWPNEDAVYRQVIDEIVEVGDQVVTVTRIGGRGPKGSRYETWVDSTIIRLIRFKDGRIWRMKEFPSIAEALEAAGLAE